METTEELSATRCIRAQCPTFSQVENTIEEALGELTEFYRNMCANPDKTQVTAFHLGKEQRGKEIIESIMEWS